MSPLRQESTDVTVATRGRGLHEVTDAVAAFVAEAGIATGLLTVWCCHTSASLLVTENASPDVLLDTADFFADLAPEARRYRHAYEGADDMPAHLRAALTNVQLTVPVRDGAMALGTWQGIFVFEHRRAPHRRRLALHLLGQ